MNENEETAKPEEMSQRELDEYLDRLSDAGKDDSPEFARAYEIWEKNL